MKVLIVGAGQVGYEIAKSLSFDEHDISIIDTSDHVIKRISERLDVKTTLGTATDPAVLKEAGIADTDMIIAVTSSDETNIVACQMAGFLYKTKTKIARISNPIYEDYNDLFGQNYFNLDFVVSPEKETVDSIVRNITLQGISDLKSYANDTIFLASITCVSEMIIINTEIQSLPSVLKNFSMVILFVERNNSCFIPPKTTTIQEGDTIYFAVKAVDIKSVLEAFECDNDNTNDIVFIGGGDATLKISRYISNNNLDIGLKLIEKNWQRAEFLSDNLDNAEIIHGDAFDTETLESANIKNSDCVIAATGDDKVNIVACLLSKKYGARRVALLLNDISYSKTIQRIGINTVIDPRQATVFKVLQYIRKGGVEMMETSSDGLINIMSVEVMGDSYAIGSVVDDIAIQGEIQISVLVRGNDIHLLPKKLIINVGDKIIFAIKNLAVKKIEKLFAAKPRYLV